VETGKVPDEESVLKMKEALGGISDPRQQGRRAQGGAHGQRMGEREQPDAGTA